MDKDSVTMFDTIKDVLYDIRGQADKKLEISNNIILDEIRKVASGVKFDTRTSFTIFISEAMFNYLKHIHPNSNLIGDEPTLFGYKVDIDKELSSNEYYLKTYIRKE